ncbi:hypothetical protein SBRCBS47491_005897 [Sporothrix bragantina]|uniref:Salicylate hydroxylase n=1 Tax=Sporothrix bragantina TaxID=671064 RepID=A0ABP0C0D5_9PEZI
MDTPQYKLKVAIVGAGIAGLSAAIGLCRAGHDVEIYERSRLANEVGAAIHVCPNASRILKEWEFDFEHSKAVVVDEGCFVNASTLESEYQAKYDDLVTRYGSPWYFLHRVDLHNELKRLAVDAGAQLLLGQEIKAVDCDTCTLTFPDGSTMNKDVIIAADGVHSKTTGSVNDDVLQADETGQSAFRFMIPAQKLVDAGLANVLNIGDAACMNVAKDADRRLVWYPCRGGDLLNFVGIHPSRAADKSVDQWNVGASIDSLLDEYKSFHPDLVRACALAEDLKLWKLLYRPPIANWYKNCVALAGDAAHPMLPHQGQGGAQAIEDGAALGVLFTDVSSPEDVTARLQLYQDIRQRRAAAIQIFSNAGQDQAARIQQDAKKYVDGHIPSNQAEFHEFNFGYDVMASAREALRRSVA